MQPSEEIKQRINIVDLVGEYVQLRKAGVNFRAPCPLHNEKTPSFIVSPVKQIWHCFGCGLGGDIFEFIKQMEGVEFGEALHMLAARAGITLKKPTAEYRAEADKKKVLYEINDLAAKYFAKVLEASQGAEAARQYIQKRGFKQETIKKWQLGYSPDDFHAFENFVITRGFQKQEVAAAGLLVKKDDGSFYDRFRGRVMFPIFDIHGRVVGFTGRILKDAEGAAKYVNSPETEIYSKSQVLYGLNFARTEIRKDDSVVIVEGNVDVITCHEFGFMNVVGSSGTALTGAALELLKRFTNNISFAFDVDEAGLLASRRAVELALSFGFNVRLVTIPKGLAKDPDELIRKDIGAWRKALAAAVNFLDFYFSQIFAKLDLTASSGKKEAVSQILPLLSLLPDPIDRQHYLQKLANIVGVEEKLLLEILNKQKRPSQTSPRDKPGVPRPKGGKTKLQILQERLLGLMLKFPDMGLSGELKAEDFSSQEAREIFLSAAAGNLPEKLQNAKELLMFAVENELAAMPERAPHELGKEFLDLLRGLQLRDAMKSLEMKIKQAESGGRADEARALSGQFNNLARELKDYHG